MKTSYDIIKRPIITEKSALLAEKAVYTFEVAKEANDIGIHSWGKLDFLQNYCGWKVISVNMTEIQKAKLAEREARKEERKKEKEERKAKKLSMVGMVKNAIKKPKMKK